MFPSCACSPIHTCASQSFSHRASPPHPALYQTRTQLPIIAPLAHCLALYYPSTINCALFISAKDDCATHSPASPQNHYILRPCPPPPPSRLPSLLHRLTIRLVRIRKTAREIFTHDFVKYIKSTAPPGTTSLAQPGSHPSLTKLRLATQLPERSLHITLRAASLPRRSLGHISAR